MSYLNCPACHLSMRAGRATHEHCPRCLRRDGEHIPLIVSPLPYRLLAQPMGTRSESGTVVAQNPAP